MINKGSNRPDSAHLISTKRSADLRTASANIDLYRINKQLHESVDIAKRAHIDNTSVRT